MNFSRKQKLFLNEALEGKNIYLSGKAGTGKSFIIKELISSLKKKNKKVVAIAPTGIAANNIGGQTIHSMFNLNPYGVISYKECNFLKSEKRRLLAAIDTIIIDEVSMLRPDVLDGINWTLLKNGLNGLDSKQIIFVGDFKQLPPVINDNTRSVLMRYYDGDRMFDSKIYPKMNVHVIELDEVLRQSDTEFIHALNTIRDGGKDEYFRRFVGTEPNDGVVLAPYNTTVAEYNIKGLEALKTETFVFDAIIEGNIKADDFNFESKITVKNGCKIMYLSNSKDAPLVNGTIGIFSSYQGNHYIHVNGVDWKLETVKIHKKEYVLNEDSNDLELQEIGSIEQYPIRLAYALSIHKSQGMTFDSVTIDLRKPCFVKEQLYVALSRVKTPEGLRILVGDRK